MDGQDIHDADLDRLRARLDNFDDELMRALSERFAICERIAEHKRKHGISIMQPARVEAVHARVATFAVESGLDARFVRRLYNLIIEEACSLERRRVVGANDAPVASLLARNASRIDHVAIAVRDLEAAIGLFRSQYGFELIDRADIEGLVSGMKTATMRAGGVTFVLCQGTSAKSNVSQYIDAYGPGIQHLAIEVDNQEEVLADAKERGADLLTGIIEGPGLNQSFTRRDTNSGMQLEFVTRVSNRGFDKDNMRALFSAMEGNGVF
ncbi:chorismate mutase family protein [Bradyrhizobium yuanmingense]|uniref:chorismate mutase family protein n=1 Tax=Bradyrhizobium yuanmingense TaxID=108015 RepID=UPI001CD7DC6E|nr:chorismate mutase family protein [Bradyrhizobium yuanmingense]MCA1530860.1 chorismate mutase family protein [Bradyrhizobium yuanmingense]